MFRTTLRLITLFALLGSMVVSIGPVRAQSTPNDLVPKVDTVAAAAFHPANAGITAASTQVVQTDSIAAPKAFTDLMLRWQAQEPAGSALLLEIRVSADGTAWSSWGTVDVSDDPPGVDDPADSRWSDPIHADLSRFYQLRVKLTPNDDGATPTFHNMQVHTVDTRIPNEQAPQASTGGSISAQAVGRPAYVSRSSWGSPDGEGSRAFVNRRAVTHLVVHHTADSSTLSSSEPNWAARVRAYWSFHAISRGWGDIGYNWLIDPNGVIYAGRSGSTDDTDKGGAVGFHDTANFGSMGVSVIGNYTSSVPSAAAQNSLVNLLAWKAGQRGINPHGASFYYGCSISTQCSGKVPNHVIANIAGHRQISNTTCPGDAFMGILQNIRDRVAQRISGVPDDGNGVIDELEPSFSGTGGWKVADCGYGGSTKWTHTSNETDGIPNTNSGVWRPNLRQSGQYIIRIHIPQRCGIYRDREYATSNARYEINSAEGSVQRWVDQRTAQPYVEFGPFQFDGGTNGYVKLTDLTSEAYFGDTTKDTVIYFDAVEWIYQAPRQQAKLLSASLQAQTIPIGSTALVTFTVKNTGTMPLETQGPNANLPYAPIDGWIYNASECFAGSTTSAQFPKVTEKLRVTLGFADGSATIPSNCNADNGDFPWRWGLRSPLQPGETRVITGYVRFWTAGTFSLDANLVNEYVQYYGTDGNGTSAHVGTITVREFPHKSYIPGLSR